MRHEIAALGLAGGGLPWREPALSVGVAGEGGVSREVRSSSSSDQGAGVFASPIG